MTIKQIEEAVAFFYQRTGYECLFSAFIERYRNLKYWGGTVQLPHLSSAEKETLSRFFQEEIQPNTRIHFKKLQKAWERTRFSEIELTHFLEAFHGKPILTKEQVQEQHQLQRNSFFQNLLDLFPHSYAQSWIQLILKGSVSNRFIYKWYEEDPKMLTIMMEKICLALEQLPCSPVERMPIFASRVTKDPHAFDPKNEQGKLFIHALKHIRKAYDPFYSGASHYAEEIAELLYYFGLIRDDILNFSTCTGIIGYDQRDQVLLPWLAAWEGGHLLNPPLREIHQVSYFQPVHGSQVFIIENSSLFSEVLVHFEGKHPPLICTQGNFKIASLMLLDKLAKDGVTFYYSGDFDPEGLLMAERLKQRFPELLRFWRYDLDSYTKCLSDKKIGRQRLKKLDRIINPDLKVLKEQMFQWGLAGYQEELAIELIQDIEQWISSDNFWKKGESP
jgi:uncharacterized protein (TIGR02679 family)